MVVIKSVADLNVVYSQWFKFLMKQEAVKTTATIVCM